MMICGLCKAECSEIIGRIPDQFGISRFIYECNDCHSLTPEFKDNLLNKSTGRQVRFHEDLWRNSGEADLNADLNSLMGLVVSLKHHLGDPQAGDLVLELGAGRGGLLKALRMSGYDAYGCEPSAALIEKARTYYDLDGSILVKSDIATYFDNFVNKNQYKSVFLWHVFEHLDDPMRVMHKVRGIIKCDGKILIQVPLLKDKYLFPEHYFFMTHKSFHYLADKLDLSLLDLIYDEENMFATAIFCQSSNKACHSFLNNCAIPDPLSQLILLTQKSRCSYKSILSNNLSRPPPADDCDSILNHSLTEDVTSSRLPSDVFNIAKERAAMANNSQSIDIRTRSEKFSGASHNRYWWYNLYDNQYIPPVFKALSEEEWAIMSAWFKDTEERFVGPGEISIPGISFLSGLIGGNGLSRIVQCGHYAGYSSLLLGFLLRGMSKSNALFSVDIDMSMTEYTQGWIDIAGLGDVVKLSVSDSADINAPVQARDWLGGDPQIVFIDSSHQYDHTLRELDRWYECIESGGFIIMHDVSSFAQQFDSTSRGGVLPAVRRWADQKNLTALLINNFVDGSKDPNSLTYKDGCGLGLIQKP